MWGLTKDGQATISFGYPRHSTVTVAFRPSTGTLLDNRVLTGTGLSFIGYKGQPVMDVNSAGVFVMRVDANNPASVNAFIAFIKTRPASEPRVAHVYDVPLETARGRGSHS